MFEYPTMEHAYKVLDRITWGVHINLTNYQKIQPKCPDWLNSLQKQVWRNRGLVEWDATTNVVAHLYANYALKILKTMKETDIWKSNDFVIGSPAYRMSILDTTDGCLENKEIEVDGWVLTNQIELSPRRAEEFFKFLVSEEKILTLIAANEDKNVREALCNDR